MEILRMHSRLQLSTLAEPFFEGFHAPKGSHNFLHGRYLPAGSPGEARTPTCSVAEDRGGVQALCPMSQACPVPCERWDLGHFLLPSLRGF